MKRLFVDIALKKDMQTKLEGDCYHRLSRVLRFHVGSLFYLFNGDGYHYLVELAEVDKRSLTVFVKSKEKFETESSLHSILIQGISKGDRMDFAIQKAVELGVSEIYPVYTEFAAVKLDEKRQVKKNNHWQSIAISACEQSGRSAIPIVHNAASIQSVISTISFDLGIMLSPTAKDKLDELDKPKRLALLVGPEGGFSDNEIKLAKHNHFVDLNLGNRILRTETAALVALTLAQLKWGDINV